MGRNPIRVPALVFLSSRSGWRLRRATRHLVGHAIGRPFWPVGWVCSPCLVRSIRSFRLALLAAFLTSRRRIVTLPCRRDCFSPVVAHTRNGELRPPSQRWTAGSRLAHLLAGPHPYPNPPCQPRVVRPAVRLASRTVAFDPLVAVPSQGREESLPCAFVPCCFPWRSRFSDWHPVVTIATVAGVAAARRAVPRAATRVAAVTRPRPAWCHPWPQRRSQWRLPFTRRRCRWWPRIEMVGSFTEWIGRNVPGGNTGAGVRPRTRWSRDRTQTGKMPAPSRLS